MKDVQVLRVVFSFFTRISSTHRSVSGLDIAHELATLTLLQHFLASRLLQFDLIFYLYLIYTLYSHLLSCDINLHNKYGRVAQCIPTQVAFQIKLNELTIIITLNLMNSA